MICDELKENLALYADNALAPESRTVCEAHLAACPLCRAEIAEINAMRRELRKLSDVSMPSDLAASIRQSLAVEIYASKREPRLNFAQKVELFLRPRLAPYSIGAFASLLLFALSFTALWSSMNAFRDWKNAEAHAAANQNKILLASGSNRNDAPPPLLTAEEYASLRLNYSAESPSLHPQSRFLALTADFARNNPGNDSIVIVADVFADGLAQVSQIVRSSRDRRAMLELEKSLQIEPAFVPAKMDNRPEKVRVVYLIQKVDVR